MTDSTATGEVIIGGGNGIVIEYRDEPHTYTFTSPPLGLCDSVTSILGPVNDKPWLKGWASNVALKGASAIYRSVRADRKALDAIFGKYETLKAELFSRELAYTNVTSTAARRGTLTHDTAEDWTKHGIVPRAEDFTPSIRGYVRGWAKFLTEREPEFLESETVVGSAKYRYAGRLDARCYIKTLPTDPEPYEGAGLIDYKTSAQIDRCAHFPQLAGYDLGAIECGAEPSGWQAVVRLGRNGTYQIKRSTATHRTFLAALAWYRERAAL